MKLLSTILATLTGVALASNATTSGNNTGTSTTATETTGTVGQGTNIAITSTFGAVFGTAVNEAGAKDAYTTSTTLKAALATALKRDSYKPAIELTATASRRLTEEAEFYRQLSTTKKNWTIVLTTTAYYPSGVAASAFTATIKTQMQTAVGGQIQGATDIASVPSAPVSVAGDAADGTTTTSGVTSRISGLWLGAVLAVALFFNGIQF